jgi:small subunit ribosomal protein S24e
LCNGGALLDNHTALNIGMVEDVLQQAIEPPAEERVEAALSMLRMLGALDSRQNVLPLGKILLQVPCDARLGKLLLFGTVFKCLSP